MSTPDSPTPPGKPSAAPLTDRQRRVFDALLDQFLTRGFADFTIDRASRDLRCSKTTLYALGPTRDAIVTRVLVSFFRQIAVRTDATLAGHRSSAAALESYFDAIVTALEPASPAFIADLHRDPVGQQVYRRNTELATERIIRAIEAGVESGEFRRHSARFTATVIESAMDRIRSGEFNTILPAQDAYRELGQLILHGVVAHRAPSA